VLDHGRHGWLFAPKDATDLAGCLQSALEVSTEERLGRAVVAARFVADHFSLTGMTAQTMAVYEELLKPS
jgi:glycosyltransferase involved in cell wall biosynthesis